MYLKGKTFRAINTIRMKWAEHDARKGEETNVYTISLGNLKERERLEDNGVNDRIILK